MLTRSQIQRFAQKNGIGVQAQERDYIQHLILYLLYNRTQAFIFKGGTALRVVYGSNRFSEDLDFNGPVDVQEVKTLWNSVDEDLSTFGISAEIRNPWISEVGYSFDVSYRGPLFDGRDRTKGKVRVDISLRQEAVDIRRELVSSEFDDVQPFVITVLSPEHLLAEKIRALLARGKPRDVYDIWLLIRKGAVLDPAVIAAKLTLYNREISKEVMGEALKQAQAGWERDLRPLLPQFIPWEQVARHIEKLIDSL